MMRFLSTTPFPRSVETLDPAASLHGPLFSTRFFAPLPTILTEAKGPRVPAP